MDDFILFYFDFFLDFILDFFFDFLGWFPGPVVDLGTIVGRFAADD